MKLYKLKEGDLVLLKQNAEKNLNRYIDKDKTYFQQILTEEKLIEIDFCVPSLPELKTIEDYSDTKKQYEINYENSVKLYTALKNLPIYYSADEKFWTWLKHTHYFDFISERIMDKGKAFDKNKILNQFFKSKKSNRDFLINLWWNAQKTVMIDKDGNMDFCLTKIAFEYIELFNATRECQIGKNDDIIKCLLKALMSLDKRKMRKFKHKKYLLPFSKDIRLISGTSCLESMTEDELVNKFVEVMNYCFN